MQKDCLRFHEKKIYEPPFKEMQFVSIAMSASATFLANSLHSHISGLKLEKYCCCNFPNSNMFAHLRSSRFARFEVRRGVTPTQSLVGGFKVQLWQISPNIVQRMGIFSRFGKFEVRFLKVRMVRSSENLRST